MKTQAVAAPLHTGLQNSSQPSPSADFLAPLSARGKFIYAGQNKFWVRGVTYGAFRPDKDGQEYWDNKTIERDFAQMRAQGLNAVRIPHTLPPRQLLDCAQNFGLHVMVGLSAEQYIGYLIDRKKPPDVAGLVRDKVRSIAGHPALLCYGLGNEIAPAVARWLGHRQVERYLEQLYWAVKSEDPGGLVTYVNYPTTEYLDLSFLDLVCFNVYLESQDRYGAYLARLQNIAGDRPLLMSEVGLDSMRNGEARQAEVIDWQIRAAFAAGCAGAFIFSWTDEWHRAGEEVEDWAFGLTDKTRRPKPALAAARQSFAAIPFPPQVSWPRISVIVCSYNGAQTIHDCLDGLMALDYPNFEVIVVDDGSRDDTAAIAKRYPFRLINTENCGLSSARNTGLAAASGDIVAYLDDDAYPDPHWLTYLASSFINSRHVGIGGPNIPPGKDGPIADCVANAPGGPIHVLVSDEEAEHIPGCNMAFRRDALQAIGGFDGQFRIAGDDVDVCWRLQEQGGSLGYSPAAAVWHHRRNSIGAYWRQQLNYGKAEALLERKWPDKYNVAGHPIWSGRVYSNCHKFMLGWSTRIYHGVWGSAPFQSLYEPAGDLWSSLPLMPEWYLVISALAGLTALGLLWPPLIFVLPIFLLAVGIPITQAILIAQRARFTPPSLTRSGRLKRQAVTAGLHLLQPLARLCGRLRYGLSPWRRGAPGLIVPCRKVFTLWTERWIEAVARTQIVEANLRAEGACIVHGGEYDRWDLGVRGGLLGGARLLMAVEDHGAGKQFIRARTWPVCSRGAWCLLSILTALTAAMALDRAWLPLSIVGGLTLLTGIRTLEECAAAIGAIVQAVQQSLSETPR